MAATILLLGLMAQIMAPGEATCLGFINNSLLPLNVYIAGTEDEGYVGMSSQSRLIYLNGPGVPALRAGDTYRVVRPEGKIKDPYSREPIGIYYKQLGTVRIEAEGKESTTAVVTLSCQPMIKGDILLPAREVPPAIFSGKLSNRLTTYTEKGLAGSIILGKDDLRELAFGNICFIGVGSRDGVQIGDRFTVYRLQPPFDPRDLSVLGTQSAASYGKVHTGDYDAALTQMLAARKLPPRVMGDIVIVDLAETTAAGKIINSLGEMHLGDIVIKR